MCLFCEDKNLFKDKGFFLSVLLPTLCQKVFKKHVSIYENLSEINSLLFSIFFIVVEMSEMHMIASLSLQNTSIQYEIEACGKHLAH